ncbi:protein kinase [Chlorogloeopsis fritschii PCC 9212]|uniref:non-specific serine/threonine protein kinase n=1 Tax=Chlorogloeopsis fritschii PCC 6912 TaxID=211165 RepID=A0A433N5N5_CHLFR|nr:serine/threonine-protein kinase [Chlorogloeopsis fritschii]RUR76746.1 hypothetical protein PCC6912_41500 [Chlorogloeopsis fritschii PCC 6912]
MLLNERYQVIRTLGSGGFGETFLAEDTQMPSHRRCVIKLLKPIQNNPQIYQLVQERFGREAAILEDLGGSTDQIPTLYAYFQLNNQFYLVQEWVEGDTLTEKIEQQGLFSESVVRELLANLLPVLEYVHSKRIIHRDLKPDNIILRHRDGKPVLIDFGAVRESMGTVLNSQGNPTSSIVIGTPGYMPSEQAAGKPVYSSDLYSLGMTAIYLLTGQPPQALEIDSRTGEILWHSHAMNVSPTLMGIIDKAIQYHPRDRYSSAREMLQALQTGGNQTISTPTLVSAPPARLSSQSQPVVSPYSSQPTPSPSGLTDLQKILILGTFISTSILLCFLLIKSFQEVVSKPQNTQKTSSTEPFASRSTVVPTNPTQSTVSPSNVQQSLSLGWIRLGSVNNTLGTVTLGEPLIKTTQPVTISPTVVPSIGTQVTVINGVNLRKKQPQKPDYKLAERTGVVVVGQNLVILNLDYFVDSNSGSPYTTVWAEVGL